MLIVLSLASDLRSYKIKNSIIFPFILSGLAINCYYSGVDGMLASLLGIIFPAVLLMVLFALKMLGAGDIKLFCAIGAIMGIDFVLRTIAYSFICGGLIALALLVLRKNGRQRLIHLISYIIALLFTLSLQPYTNFNDKSDGAKFHFSYAIAFGTAVQVFLSLIVYCFIGR